jgi:cysteine desulfurase
VDLVTLSGHKLHAPKGVGLLFIRRGTRALPLIIGGGQEKGRRSGTPNIPGIVGFAKALELAEARLAEGTDAIRRLRDRLEGAILERIPNTERNGARDPRLPNTTNIGFDGIEGESVLLSLDEAGVCASSGSACSTGAIEPSHVLKAMGVPSALAIGSVRFSLSRFTTEEEIDRVIDILPPIIERLRGLTRTNS